MSEQVIKDMNRIMPASEWDKLSPGLRDAAYERFCILCAEPDISEARAAKIVREAIAAINEESP